MDSEHPLPLSGIRVIEFSHMIMGPSCGMILGDLGAEVIKIEPPGGDKTRHLPGVGRGFFRAFNRNKKSLCVDLKHPDGLALVKELLATADVMLENFRPGRMATMDLDHATLSKDNPGLVYLSLKGFLPGPYENRTALDEVVQMMGGLAYMTGPVGRPLRAGSSVNDIMGGMFGVIAILAALRQRDATGVGQEIQSGLFENCVLLAAQHMQQFAVTGEAAMPMPERKAGYGIYDLFTVAGEEQVFLTVATDSQWATFCAMLGFDDLATDARLDTNAKRCAERGWMLPEVQRRLAGHTKDAVMALFDKHGLPYAPITKPHELFDDPHLNASGGLATIGTEDGGETKVPLLPLTFDGRRLGPRMALPDVGDQTRLILADLGYGVDRIEALMTSKAVVGSARAQALAS
ncbi:MAG: CoA transferase [Rhodospirillum sp.]|nr:CoA transferase [Rhodospirillum sp.]MCF8491500.1 CoA transferase [Rhodospirillum sp.]MCF8499808.1 CoA transferase [Rhodospirillum sp.]